MVMGDLLCRSGAWHLRAGHPDDEKRLREVTVRPAGACLKTY